MAITAELHDGTRLEFPDGTDPAVIQRTVKNVLAQKAPEKPAAVQTGEALREVPRQVGLTARSGIKAAATLPAMLSDAVTGIYNTGANLIQGEGKGFRFGPAMNALDETLTRVGIPAPRTANERVVSDATTMMAGTAGLAKGADVLSRNAGPVAKAALQSFAARPGVQAAGAAGAGLTGGSVREAGGGPVEQLAASLVGGVAGGVTADKTQSALNAARAALRPRETVMREADAAISLVLQRSGVDWSQVPERVRQGMRQEVAAALRTGETLDGAALRRLLVFQQTGTRPTVGMLTQNPGQITREKNLAKTGANSIDPGLQELPNLENVNVARLLQILDEAGAGQRVSLMDGGRAGVNALDALASRKQNEISALYSAARDTQGRSLPLEGGTFTRRASELIDEAMAGDSLPKSVENRLNAIARGEYPLTVASAEALKTRIGKLQRGTTDGNARYALGLVRQALDETPLVDGQRVNPGNLPAVPGTVPPSVQSGDESIAAFNAARKANREWMQTVERNPALKAVVDGVEPDQFMSRFVIGKEASAADVRKLADMLDPAAKQTIRAALVKHLRDKATGGDDDIVKFGGKTYRDAFRAIEDKLPAFFSREEIDSLRNVGDAAKYMQAQPAGSAVNNSNSGALLLGRGLDILDTAANYIPLGGRDIIKGKIQGMQQQQVLAPRNALIRLQPRQAATANPLIAATLLPAPVQSREDDRSK